MCKLQLKNQKKLENIRSPWIFFKINKRRVFNKAVGPGKKPKINKRRVYIYSVYRISRPVVPGGAGGAMAPPDFGRSVNPISTKGGRLCPPNNTGTPGFSDLPTALISMVKSKNKGTLLY